MRKIYTFFAVLGLIALSPVFFHATVNAQALTYTVDTLLKKPKANRLMVNIGGQFDADGSKGSGGGGIYLHSRYKLADILQFGGTVAMFPATNATKPDASYLIMDVYGAFYFKSEVKTANSNIKLGQGKIDGKQYKFSANIPTSQWQQTGVCAGVFNWTRPYFRSAGDTSNFKTFTATNKATGKIDYSDSAYTNVNVTGISFGLAVSTSSKSKYKFNTNYGTKIRRVNTSIDAAIEVLFAPVIVAKDEVRFVKDGLTTTYTISDVKKKHFGFRIRAEVRQKIISMRMEMGLRPGVDFTFGDKSFFNGAYLAMGFGIGIGAL